MDGAHLTRQPVANRMHQLRQFLLVGCVGALKSGVAPGRGGVSADGRPERISVKAPHHCLAVSLV